MKSDFSKNFIKIFAAAAMVIIVALTVAGTVYSENVFQNISGNVVRLHVLANSDGENDQNLKLKVRDAVVEYTEPILRDCKSQGEVLSVLADEKENIKSVAESCLKSEGSAYKAYVCVGEYDFPAKNYGKYCFPEGEYQALRVIIGEGEGKNWWCVLFPPL